MFMRIFVIKRCYLTLLCGLLCACLFSASLQAATPALELAASKKSYDLTQPWKFSKTLSWINLPANPKCTTCGALRRLSSILLKLVPYSSGMKKVCLCIKREMLFEATLISKISLYVRDDKKVYLLDFLRFHQKHSIYKLGWLRKKLSFPRKRESRNL